MHEYMWHNCFVRVCGVESLFLSPLVHVFVKHVLGKNLRVDMATPPAGTEGKKVPTFQHKLSCQRATRPAYFREMAQPLYVLLGLGLLLSHVAGVAVGPV